MVIFNLMPWRKLEKTKADHVSKLFCVGSVIFSVALLTSVYFFYQIKVQHINDDIDWIKKDIRYYEPNENREETSLHQDQNEERLFRFLVGMQGRSLSMQKMIFTEKFLRVTSSAASIGDILKFTEIIKKNRAWRLSYIKQLEQDSNTIFEIQFDFL